MPSSALKIVPDAQQEESATGAVETILSQLKTDSQENPTTGEVEKVFEDMEGVVAENGKGLDEETLRKILELEAEGLRLRIFPILTKTIYINRIKELLGEEQIDFFGESEE